MYAKRCALTVIRNDPFCDLPHRPDSTVAISRGQPRSSPISLPNNILRPSPIAPLERPFASTSRNGIEVTLQRIASGGKNNPCQCKISGSFVSFMTSTVTSWPSRNRKNGPGAEPLYPVVLMIIPGAISSCIGEMRRVASGLDVCKPLSFQTRHERKADTAPHQLQKLPSEHALNPFVLSLMFHLHGMRSQPEVLRCPTIT